MNLGPFQPNTYVVGEVRDLLRQLPDASIDCVVTSPPYWGQREYAIEPVVWGGDPGCSHQWGEKLRIHKGGPHGDAGILMTGGRSIVEAQASTKDFDCGRFCTNCGAWLGDLGLEPDYREYIEHMLEVLGEVRRVLKPQGTLWLNLGDCYATGAGPSGSPGGGTQGASWRGGRVDRLDNGRGDQPASRRAKTRATRDGTHAGKHTAMAAVGPMQQPNRLPQPGLKPKDLVGMPWRVALTLQAGGWWLRQCNIWHKPAPLPESVRDRTTTSHEYLFQLARSQDYYYDADAIKEPVTGKAHPRGCGVNPKSGPKDVGREEQGLRTSTSFGRGAGFRGRQNASFAEATTELVEKRNKRSVWTIPAEPLKDEHFSAFPTKLVQPCILAGCPAGGVVLDPFGGSGTVGRVAEDLGRHWLLFDLSPAYAEIAKRRTAQTGLLLRCAQ